MEEGGREKGKYREGRRGLRKKGRIENGESNREGREGKRRTRRIEKGESDREG